ncbi:MAG: PEGA domain-containing protein [Prevotella sp.]|nr:PEGA domain-containing protein [Prevotella sp.]
MISFEQSLNELTAQNPQYERRDGGGDRYAIVRVKTTSPDDDLREYQFNFGLLKHIVGGMHDDELWVYVQRNAKSVTISRKGYATIKQYDLRTTIQPGCTYVMQLSPEAAPVSLQTVKFNVVPADAKAVVTVQSDQKGAQTERLDSVDPSGAIAKSLPLGTYTYTIMAPDYKPYERRLLLNEPNQTLVEKVVLEPDFAEMTLRATPEADIYVNGELHGRGTWAGRMKSGTYEVECRQQRHKPSALTLTVRAGEPRTVNLPTPTPITGTLNVTSRPLGATITIDGKGYGQTPKSIEQLPIGQHRLTLARANYTTEQRDFEIKENETTEVDVTLNDIARMTIASSPSGAQLSIDGKAVGQTPYSADMASGDYQLRLAYKGYRDFSARVHLDSSQPATTITLRRQHLRPTGGYLSVQAQRGQLMAAGGAVGAYIYNVNVEATYLMGLSNSGDIYWNSTADGERPRLLCYKPTVMGLRLGYGIILGTRARLTPQAGMSAVQLKSNDGSSKGSATAATVGLRADYAVLSHMALFAAPEMSVALSKSDVFSQLADVSSKIKAWGTGFNLRAGLMVYF